MDSPALPPLPAGLCPTLPLVCSLARSRACAVGFGWCAGDANGPRSVGRPAGVALQAGTLKRFSEARTRGTTLSLFLAVLRGARHSAGRERAYARGARACTPRHRRDRRCQPQQ